jgi:hypothetical protein
MTMRQLALAGLAAAFTVGCSAQPENTPAQSPPQTSAPASGPVTAPKTDAEKIANAMAAAPGAVSQQATILDFDSQGQARTLREGSNGWTCLPDNPQSPGVDPMCLDANGFEWAKAWMSKTEPPRDKMGFGYMLLGGSDAHNEDPHATAPPAGHQWIDTGPHVMILNIGDRFAGYPTTHDNPKAPFVMWPNTPYAHLMIPVGDR